MTGFGWMTLGRLGELCRGLELALGVDHLRAPVSLGLGLAGQRLLHVLGNLRRP